MSEKSEPAKVHIAPFFKWLHKKHFNKKLFCSARFLVSVVVIVCVIIGGLFILAKIVTYSYSLWPNNPIPKTISASDSSSIELGVKFASQNSGYITGIRFYKSSQNTGVHIGSLWGDDGALLASVTFTDETVSGWQTAMLVQPVNIAANVMYIVSYLAPNGHYSFNSNYFSHDQAHSSGPLTAFADNGTYGANGVYTDSAVPEFPGDSMNGTNFWVEPIFSTKLIGAPVAPAPPTIISAFQNGSSIAVAWNNGSSANPITSYRIIRNSTQIAVVSNETLNYVDNNIVAGRTYSYQVETVDNMAKVSALSNNATVTYNYTPAPSVTLFTSAYSVAAGAPVTLAWYSTNSTYCQAVSPAAWTLSMLTIGSQTVTPTSTTTYSLLCHNNWGSISSTPVTVKVAPTVTLTASTASITAGNAVTLNWSSTNTTSCQAATPANWTASMATSGSKIVYPTATTTYTIICRGSGGSITSSPVSIKVTPAVVAVAPASLQPVGNIAGSWNLVFDSEFNGSALDSSQWSTGVDGAPGITDGYTYTMDQECYDPAQVSVGNGELNLTAISKTESCPPVSGSLPYASGTVTTFGHFSYTYGYAEARIWLPGTTSIADWPAFWELGHLYNVSKGEIDIVEGTQGQACATFHNASSNPSFCSSQTFTGGWHTFAADWEPGVVYFYYDGVKVLSVTSGVTAYPMYLVLDLALATKITKPDTVPVTMQVDYVRVLQH